MLPVDVAAAVETPALIYSELELQHASERARAVADAGGCKLLFSIKACALQPVVEAILPFVDGFSCSSIFEARWARSLAARQHAIHLVSPFLPLPELARHPAATHIAFNSVSQFVAARHARLPASVGLRVNPEQSWVADARYDPCRPSSQLGARLQDLRDHRGDLTGVEGLHFHSNCDSVDLAQLAESIHAVAEGAADVLKCCRWLNVGGGYLLHSARNIDEFAAAAHDVRSSFPEINMFVEPGEAVVGGAGSLVTTVADVFDVGGRSVAIIDTTVNHLADVLDFDSPPRVAGSAVGGSFRYILAGVSCLAGDRLGEYGFEEPLRQGSRLVIEDVGAYTWSKATMFNGIPLPHVYITRLNGTVERVRTSTYEEYTRLHEFAP